MKSPHNYFGEKRNKFKTAKYDACRKSENNGQSRKREDIRNRVKMRTQMMTETINLGSLCF